MTKSQPRTVDAVDIPFPDKLLCFRAIIQGASGAGKTYAIRRILKAKNGGTLEKAAIMASDAWSLRGRIDSRLPADLDVRIAQEV